MKTTISNRTPLSLLRTTLAYLAENVGGYKKGDDFLALFDKTTDPDATIEDHEAGLQALAQLIHNCEGAHRALTNEPGIDFETPDAAPGAVQADGQPEGVTILGDFGQIAQALAAQVAGISGIPDGRIVIFGRG